MIRVESPPTAPGYCAISRTSTGPFIDTLVDYDDLPNIGRVYISFDSVSEMAQMMGMLPASSVERITAERDQAVAEQARLAAELDKLQSVRAVLDGWKPEEPMAKPTPTELRHQAARVLTEEQVAELADATGDPGFFDEPDLPDDDTPDGRPLPDDDHGFVLTGSEDRAGDYAVIRAFYGEEPDSLADLIALDPPPEKVDPIMEWVDSDENPVIRRVRREIAVAVEQSKSEKDQRKTVLALKEQA